jgi:transposase
MAQKDRVVIMGADTHKRFHTVAVISETGEELDSKSFDADASGYRKALRWARRLGRVSRAGVEATGSYGAGLSAYLKAEGVETLDVYAPDKRRRRLIGKDNEKDAFQAAQAALSRTRCATAKDRGGEAEALRLMESAYGQLVKQRTAAINALKAALVVLPDRMRARLEGLSTAALVRTCAAFRAAKDLKGLENGAKTALRSLARTVSALDKEIAVLDKEIGNYARALLPNTLALYGVGRHGAVKFLNAAGKNIGRIKGEASFSMLCGASPVPASTGDACRYRLNRGGDRQANSALYVMALNRIRACERTQAFIAKKMGEGKSKRDAVRALKRYLAREVYAALMGDLALLAS